MAEADTCSLTPPVSPMMQLEDFPELVESPPKKPRFEDADSEMPVCFACLGEASQKQRTHPQSYLQLGAIERLTSDRGVAGQHFDSMIIELFGHQFVSYLALDESMETLFYLCRQYVDKINHGSNSPSSFLPIRHKVRSFFDYMKEYCIRYENKDSTTSDSFLQRLLRQLHGLMLYMGQINELPKHIISSCSSRQGNQSLLGTYHLFHLHLDVKWSIAEVLHLLSLKYPGSCNSVQLFNDETEEHFDVDIFSQFTRVLMWDLVLTSLPKFNQLSHHDYGKTPFACSCCKEFLILYIKLLNFRHEKRGKQPFWLYLNPLLQNIFAKSYNTIGQEDINGRESDKYDMPPKFESSDGVGFCWWLLIHYAPLYRYDQFGVPQDCKLLDSSQNNYLAVQTLVKTMLAKRLSEGQLRCYLKCCLTLSELWGPNGDVVSLLWEHFYKRLNEPFRQASLGIEGFASVNKSPSNWLDECRLRCSGDSSKLESDSSYHLFLRILAVHLRSQESKTNTTWNKLKGRFYTKFHARRMQELTEVGLINITSLFLHLAIATRADDVVAKLCDLYMLVAPKDITRRATIWKGQFAAVMYLLQSQKDVGFIAKHLAEAFDNVCREASTEGLDPSRYTELYTLINLYLDATQDVIESSSSLALSEHKLIGTCLGDLLKTCRESELRTVLSFSQAILTKVRSVSQRSDDPLHVRYLSDAFWKQVFGFVKSHATTGTPPSQLADLAASFALHVINSPPSIQSNMKEDFIGVFSYFGWNEQVSTRLSCRFLNHLLPNQSAIDCLSRDLNDFETSLIAAWFRCAWQLSSEDPQMSELTRLLMKLPQMKDVFQDSGVDPDLGEEPVVHRFIRALGKQYSGITDLRQKVGYQARVNAMLGNVIKHIVNSQRSGASEELKVAYRLGGLLAKYCAPILYIKSNPRCIFPELIERLALPRVLLNPNKPVSSSLLAAIRENLYLFVQGLSKLDFRRDPYIQRKVKEIVGQYLTRFPLKASVSLSVSIVHPLLTSLGESCSSQPNEESVLFRQHVLKLVKDEVLTTKGNNSNISVGLGFISALISTTQDVRVIARDCDVLLRVVLDYVLLGQAQATTAMQLLLEACALVDTDPIRISVSQIVEVFVSQQMGAYQGRIMKLLESASALYPAGLVPVIPAMSGAVRTSETKRGVGVDKQLRVLYFSVLDHLGDEGQAEKSALLMSNV